MLQNRAVNTFIIGSIVNKYPLQLCSVLGAQNQVCISYAVGVHGGHFYFIHNLSFDIKHTAPLLE